MLDVLLFVVVASYVGIFVISMAADGTKDTNKTRCDASCIKLAVSFIGMVACIGIQCYATSPDNIQRAKLCFLLFVACAIISAFSFGFYLRGEVEEDYKNLEDDEDA